MQWEQIYGLFIQISIFYSFYQGIIPVKVCTAVTSIPLIPHSYNHLDTFTTIEHSIYFKNILYQSQIKIIDIS